MKIGDANIVGSALHAELGRNMATQMPKEATVQEAFEAFSAARDLFARVSNLADRLLGPVPHAAGAEAKIATPPSGVLDELSREAGAIRLRADQAHFDLNRIERFFSI